MARRILIVALLLTMLVAVLGAGTKSVRRAARQQSVAVPQSSQAQVYGGFWQQGPGYSTTLILRNKDQQNPLAVTLVLYTSSGQVDQTAQLQLAASQEQQVALGTIVAADGNLHGGGLALEFDSAAIGVAAVAVVTNASNGSSVNLLLGGGYPLDTENALYAPWSLGDGNTDGNLELFNTSGQPIVVTPSVTVQGQGVEQPASSINLAPNASQAVSLRSLLAQVNAGGANVGAITLRYSGPAHALQPALVLANSSGLWMASGFQARHSQPGTASALARWVFPELKLRWSGAATSNPLHGYALLSNGTKTAMTVDVLAHFAGGKGTGVQKADLPVLPLGPLETRLVDLSQFVTSGTITGDPAHLALVVGHSGAPGDLSLTVFSVTPANDLVFASPGTLLSPAVVDTSYWKVGATAEAPSGVSNPGSAAAQTQVVLYYVTPQGMGSYQFPVTQLAANSEQKLTLGRVSRTLDVHGLTVPAGTSYGLATLVAPPAGASSAALVVATQQCERQCATVATATIAPVAKSSPSTAASNGPTPDFGSGGGDGTPLFTQHCFPPSITGINPSHGAAGTLVSVTISGTYCPEQPQVNIDGNSISVINVARGDGAITAQFDIAYDPSAVTSYNVTVSGPHGTSDPVTFTVDTPQPLTIESVDPTPERLGRRCQESSLMFRRLPVSRGSRRETR